MLSGQFYAQEMSTSPMLEIEFPVMRYDITMPLLEGRVVVDGVKLKPVKTSSMISKEDRHTDLQDGAHGLGQGTFERSAWRRSLEASLGGSGAGALPRV